MPIVTFLSDFGLADEWAGVCKAVITERAPGTQVIDVCHEVPAYDIRRGAFLLAAALPPLRPAIHLAIVDSGVGTQRRALILETRSGHVLVGPDNGLLIPAADRAGGIDAAWELKAEKLPSEVAPTIAPSATFQARDLFAPAVAALALGHQPSALGDPADPTTLAPAPWRTASTEEKVATAEVIQIDGFGSIHLAVERTQNGHPGLALEPGHKVEISTPKGGALARSVETFGDAAEEEPVCLWDSTGFLTIAVNMGDASRTLGVKVGDEVRVRVLSR